MIAPLPPTSASDAELVTEWRAAMEGVTPGPWRPSRFGFQVVSDYPEPAWQSVVELKTIARSEPNAEREMLTQQAIANWLARCSPSGIATLLDRLDQLSAEVAAKDDALRPFATVDPMNIWDEDDNEEAVSASPLLSTNDFLRARAALSPRMEASDETE